LLAVQVEYTRCRELALYKLPSRNQHCFKLPSTSILSALNMGVLDQPVNCADQRFENFRRRMYCVVDTRHKTQHKTQDMACSKGHSSKGVIFQGTLKVAAKDTNTPDCATAVAHTNTTRYHICLVATHAQVYSICMTHEMMPNADHLVTTESIIISCGTVHRRSAWTQDVGINTKPYRMHQGLQLCTQAS